MKIPTEVIHTLSYRDFNIKNNEAIQANIYELSKYLLPTL